MFLAFLLMLTPSAPPADWRTPYEKGDGNTTATYAECVAYYQRLAAAYPKLIHLRETGHSDGGLALHEVVIGSEGAATPQDARRQRRPVVLVQNGIHPGEPEGIDASMMLVRDLVQKPAQRALLDKITLVVVPVYNADGMVNRGPHSRVNQLGPAEYGFRGNARNPSTSTATTSSRTRATPAPSRRCFSTGGPTSSWKPTPPTAPTTSTR